MKIAASIYSGKNNEFIELIQMLDEHHIDYFHVDCNDNTEVFEDIKTIRKISKTPVDLHLITSNPEKYLPLLSENPVENLTFQYENLPESFAIPDSLKHTAGLALVASTPIEKIEPYTQYISHVLFMATVPGQSGGMFDGSNFQKIRQFASKYPKIKMHVDGGINAELSFILRNMGVSLIVVGSYLFKSNYLGVSLLNLKSDNIESHYQVKQFMRTDNLPVIDYQTADMKNVLESIEKFNLGFAVVVDRNMNMKGMVTTADIRKALIKYFPRYLDLKINEIMNPAPVFIKEDKSISELLLLIKKIHFPLLYLPVTDSNKKLTGIITFNNLIKGEV